MAKSHLILYLSFVPFWGIFVMKKGRDTVVFASQRWIIHFSENSKHLRSSRQPSPDDSVLWKRGHNTRARFPRTNEGMIAAAMKTPKTPMRRGSSLWLVATVLLACCAVVSRGVILDHAPRGRYLVCRYEK